MRGSYRPPSAIENGGVVGWDVPPLLGKPREEDVPSKAIRGWRQDILHKSAWWEQPDNAAKWKPRSKTREEQGRLIINPVTGKLEDIAPVTSTGGKVMHQASKSQGT
jgi:hypothetical protein